MPRMSQSEYKAYLSKRFDKPTIEGIGNAKCESDLHDSILAECRSRGWIAFHGSMAHRTHRTIGEPDFVILMQDGKSLLVECKSKTGKLTTEQAALAAMAEKLGHTVWTVRSMDGFMALLPPKNL